MNQATELNFEYMCPKMDVDNVDNHLTKLNFRIYVCENGRRKRRLTISPNSDFEYVCAKMDVDNVD